LHFPFAFSTKGPHEYQSLLFEILYCSAEYEKQDFRKKSTLDSIVAAGWVLDHFHQAMGAVCHSLIDL